MFLGQIPTLQVIMIINKHTDSGIPYNFKVTFVMIPKVPSEPTKRFVRLYPADVFLRRIKTF